MSADNQAVRSTLDDSTIMDELHNLSAVALTTSAAIREGMNLNEADAAARVMAIVSERAIELANQIDARSLAAHQRNKTEAPEAAAAPAPTIPPRRHYRGSDQFEMLPFVERDKDGISIRRYWHVPPTDDYRLACRIGSEYAAHLVQYLKDNPEHVGIDILGDIVRDIDFGDEGRRKGYWVGFFSHLERILYAQAEHSDPFADLDRFLAEDQESERQAEAQP